MKKLFILLLLLAGASSSYAQVDIENQFQGAIHFYNSTKIPFRLFTPKITLADGKVGLVLALHGAGEEGTDNYIQIQNNHMATYWAQPMVQSEYPCFVLVPQYPVGIPWQTKWVYENVIDLVDSLTNACPIDTTRLYVTGLSMGGLGTWLLMDKYPDKFAAAVPVCGEYNTIPINKIKNIPLWDFHGQNDGTVPTDRSRELVFAFDKIGCYFVYPQCLYSNCNLFTDKQYQNIIDGPFDHLYSEVYGVGHNVWDVAYTDPYLYKWMLSKAKRTEGAIALLGFDSYGQISGNSTINWVARNPNDSVEIWLSHDLENSWIKIGKTVTSVGSYTFNSKLVEDCAFATIKLLTRNNKGFSNGATKSVPQAINNDGNSKPFLKISPESYLRMSSILADSIPIKMKVGDAENDSLTIQFFYSMDGKTFAQVDKFTTMTSLDYQTFWLNLKLLKYSKEAKVRIDVSDGNLTTSFMSTKFINLKGCRTCADPIGEVIINSDKSYVLLQNFPNPFNSATTISWQLANKSKTTLKIFDLVGREVATLVDEHRPSGKYETQFNAAMLPKGVYFYQLKAGEYSQTRKLIVIK